jgi:hypothetical protein
MTSRTVDRYGSYEDRTPNSAALSASLKLVNAVRKIKFRLTHLKSCFRIPYAD